MLVMQPTSHFNLIVVEVSKNGNLLKYMIGSKSNQMYQQIYWELGKALGTSFATLSNTH